MTISQSTSATDNSLIASKGHVDQTASFEAEIRPVLEQARTAVAAVVEAIQPPVRRVAELQKTLGIDYHLSWSMFTAAHVNNPLQIVSLLPGERAMGKFFDKAAGRGVSKEVIGRGRAAMESFEAMVRKHAGSREVFESMVVGLTPEEVDPNNDVDLRNKRAAFRANAMLWGQQSRQNVVGCILHPSATANMLDFVLLRGIVGWHQTRPGSVLRLGTRLTRQARPGDPAAPVEFRELVREGTGDQTSAGLLHEFSSQPLPEFRAVVDSAGKVLLECSPPTLGITGEITYFTGHVGLGGTAMPGSTPESEFGYRNACYTPTELYVCDCLVHQSVWDERLPNVTVHGAPSAIALGLQDSDPLPLREKAVYLGVGVESARSPELPRHTEMLRFAIEKMGWDPNQFRVFRLRVEYPVLYARIGMIFRK